MKQQLINICIGALTAIGLTAMNHWPRWWIFLVVLFIWIGMSGIAVYMQAKTENMARSFLSIMISMISIIGLLVLLEDKFGRYVIIIMAGVVTWFLLTYASHQKTGLSYQEKPFKRIMTIILVFDIYALLSLVFALGIFFSQTPFWLLALIGSLLVASVSVIIWQIYFEVPTRKFLLWGIMAGLVMWEMLWVMSLLPFGYLVLGALSTWVWYIMHLLVRFHLSHKGIIWKKQLTFLIINLVIYFLILFLFVRWI